MFLQLVNYLIDWTSRKKIKVMGRRGATIVKSDLQGYKKTKKAITWYLNLNWNVDAGECFRAL